MNNPEMKFRVENPEHSKKIQKALFERGYRWIGPRGDSFHHVDKPFLLTGIYGSKYIYQCRNISLLNEYIGEVPEYNLREIVSYDFVMVEKEPETIELNGKTYLKSDLEEALSKLNPV